jgi:hypothetical protein
MKISESGPSAGGGGGRYYDIIVGNAVAGDTLAVCDYLDTGNGMAWKAALLAASLVAKGVPLLSVFTRHGVYDLGAAGSDGLPIVVPAGVLNVCDGRAQTVIHTSGDPAATGGIAALQVDGELWDVGVLLTNPTTLNSNVASSEVMLVTETGSVRRIALSSDVVTTPANLGTIFAAAAYLPGSYSEDISATFFPPTSPLGVFVNHYATQGAFSPPSPPLTRLVRPTTDGDSTGIGGTLGIWVLNLSHVQITEPVIYDPTTAGIFVQAEQATRIDVQITDPHIRWRYADTVFQLARGAIIMQANQVLAALGSLDGVRVTRGFFDNFAATNTGSHAIQMLAIGAGFISVVKNCEVVGAKCRNWDEAAHVAGTGISTVNANGIVETDTGGAVINNVNDQNFRTMGNW